MVNKNAGNGVGKDGQRQPTFEEMFEELERVVRNLESGDSSLEQSVKLYARGTGLAKACRELLNRAELKINELREALEETEPADSSQESRVSDSKFDNYGRL